MILHLVHDEKIINRIIALFEEAAPNNNLFVVFTRHQLKNVQHSDKVVLFKNFEKTHSKTVLTSVIVHFLNSRKIRFINKYIDKNVSISWIIWGNDLYNKLLYPKGFELYDRESSYHKNFKNSFHNNFFIKIVNDFKTIKIEKFISKRIDYIVTDASQVDYKNLLEYYPKLKDVAWKEFFYYPIESVLGDELSQKWVQGNTIQIGNSASITNNHEYAMRFLSKLNIGDKNVIVPISYSGTKEYKMTIKNKGEEYFGSHFTALEEFLPLNEYNNLMLSFGIAIYGNFRQEALGNILISIYLGAKVFLPKSNPLFLWAMKLNLIIFELEAMSQEQIDLPLDDLSRRHNRSMLQKFYNKERLKKLIIDNFVNEKIN